MLYICKINLKQTKNRRKKMTTTKKEKFEVRQTLGGQYAIFNENNNIVFGGDSACEDHYNIGFMQDVYESWDGSLNEDGCIDYDRISINFNTI